MKPPDAEYRARAEALRERLRDEIRHGRMASAVELATEGVDLARAHGDHDDLDRAICNRASLLVAQGEGAEAIVPLREILMRSPEPAIRLQAADCVAGYHAQLGQTERALFYARLAVDFAEKTGEAEARIKTRNNLGQLSLSDSRFDDARSCFRECLELMDLDPGAHRPEQRSLGLSNLAYCEALLGDTRAGFQHAFRSLRITRREDVGTWEMYPRLVLGHLYIEIGRYDRAARHSRRGLELAETHPGHAEWIKNGLYLAGEADKLRGRVQEAYATFSDLQMRFYPDQPFIVSLLMTTDIRGMINLMA
jgi:tetratricopeptide (TPR) repeat protein